MTSSAGPSANGKAAPETPAPEVPPSAAPGWWVRLSQAVQRVREAVRVLAGTPRVLRLVWEAHPGYATALVALNVVQGLEPLAQLWLTKLIVDAVAAALGATSAAGALQGSQGAGL